MDEMLRYKFGTGRLGHRRRCYLACDQPSAALSVINVGGKVESSFRNFVSEYAGRAKPRLGWAAVAGRDCFPLCNMCTIYDLLSQCFVQALSLLFSGFEAGLPSVPG